MYQEITMDQLEDILSDGAILVDVREEDEIEAGAIPGHKAMPLSSFDSFRDEISKDKPTIFYCGSGKRSLKACQIAQQWTEQQLFSLAGGYIAYAEANQ